MGATWALGREPVDKSGAKGRSTQGDGELVELILHRVHDIVGVDVSWRSRSGSRRKPVARRRSPRARRDGFGNDRHAGERARGASAASGSYGVSETTSVVPMISTSCVGPR